MSATGSLPSPVPRERAPRTLLLVALVLLLAGAAAFLWPRTALKSDAEDPLAFAPPASSPRGSPVRLRSTLAAGDRLEGSGSFSYRQAATGRFGGMPLIPSREVEGTFTSSRRVEAKEGGTLVSTVEVRVKFAETSGAAAKVPGEAAVTLSFEHGHVDTSSLPSTRLVAPLTLRPALEVLVEAWTQRTPLVGLDPREGEAFAPKEGMDIEPMRRQAFQLFRYDGRGVAPVEGAVWLEGVRGEGAGAEADVRTWLRHAQAGNTADPFKARVLTDYLTVVRGSYRIGVLDGLPHALEVRAARKMRVHSDAFDYHVRIDLAANLTETRVR